MTYCSVDTDASCEVLYNFCKLLVVSFEYTVAYSLERATISDNQPWVQKIQQYYTFCNNSVTAYLDKSDMLLDTSDSSFEDHYYYVNRDVSQKVSWLGLAYVWVTTIASIYSCCIT